MEILQERPDEPIAAALFDFDGTLSLLRRNWHQVMIPMMVDELSRCSADPSRETLEQVVEAFVMRLNGKQTIYQMIELAEQVRARGGQPLDPLQYKQRYHDLLWEQVESRVQQVQSGAVEADAYCVPGARALLQALEARDVVLYLASGTDVGYVRDELRTLELDRFFGDRVYGALDDYQNFSKAMIIRRMIDEAGFQPQQIVGFGDGFVEIEEVSKAGGYAVGVASNEETREGVNDWKRERLIGAGAHAIVGDYRQLDELLTTLRLR